MELFGELFKSQNYKSHSPYSPLKRGKLILQVEKKNFTVFIENNMLRGFPFEGKRKQCFRRPNGRAGKKAMLSKTKR